MKTILILLGIVVIVVAIFQGYRIFKYGKISKKLIEETKAYSLKNTNPTGKFLILGDSLGVGIGATNKESISGRLHEDFPEVDITNKSVSGAKIMDGLKIIRSLDLKEHFNLTIILLGANDILRFTPKTKAENDLRALLLEANKISNQVIFVTPGSVGYAPVFIEPLSTFYTSRSRKFIESFEKISSEADIRFLSLFFSKEEDPFLKNVNLYYSGDRFHPSGAGYGVWFEMIKNSLKK
jgi:lysophospholipase L1-like esterase